MAPMLKPLVAMTVLAATVIVWMSGGCGGNRNNPGLGGDDGTGNPSALGDDSGASSGASSSGGGSGMTGFGGSSSGFMASDGGGFHPDCPPGSPLSCYVDPNCPSGNTTTIKGRVFDPAGKNPIFNVVVFVPNDPKTLPAIVPGTNSCSACDTSVGDYVAATLTDTSGAFTLKGVPTGNNVPLVLQIGKWRRLMTVPSVPDCKTTTLPSSGSGQARLPKNRQEGDIPQMALLTGGLDDLGCFLYKVGIDPKEYSAPKGGGRLDIYQGLGGGAGGLLGGGGGKAPGLSNGGTAGNCTTTSCPLWANKQSFENYDIVFLACEGDTYDADENGDAGAGLFGGGGGPNVTKAGKQALHDWLDEGGKVFATHFHYTWFKNGPPDFQAVATWLGSSIGNGTCTNCTLDTSFQSGKDFQAWLQGVGALSGGGITLKGVADSVSTVNTATTNRWIYGNSGRGGATDTKYMSFETPIGGIPIEAGPEMGGKQYCGKAVFTDLHAGGSPSGDIPGACQNVDLTAQEKALEFLIFNLAACVSDESMPMKIPPPPPK
jgi:hypothetical protein